MSPDRRLPVLDFPDLTQTSARFLAVITQIGALYSEGFPVEQGLPGMTPQ